ncbi:MAG: DapH/DapD/GlmU-related protein [Phycisphaerae bacterium]|jgi:acetyltransferase-like isoleucine patch superfamily enzyme|nr:DapH/DapD/GlmU-related protein [Phycisphaerae bacterium]
MGNALKQTGYELRYALPLWLVGVLTNWWPDNRVTVRVRGWLASWFVRRCGKNFQLGSYVFMTNIHKLSIGDNCYFSRGVWIDAMGGLEVEDEVVMSPYVLISTSTHGFKDGSVRFAGAHPAPVRIGKGTWIAAHAVVVAGVTVGRGVLVAANAVVAKDAPDHMMVGGVPAKVIGPVEDREPEITSRFG